MKYNDLLFRTSVWGAVLSFGLGISAHADARELTIGVQTETTAVDPHNYVGGGDAQVRITLFDSLVAMDAQQKVVPALAESWEIRDDSTWAFKLREGAKFHNGSPFTANDVIYTICRIRNFKEALSSYARYTNAIQSIEALDDHELVVKTKGAYPALLNELTAISVLSAKAGEVDGKITFDDTNCGVSSWPTVSDFNSGAMAVGTGPYKFVSYTPATSLTFDRNDDYWGGLPDWEKLTIRPIANSAARLASLLAGDVDLIDSPPPQDIERLEQDPRIKVTSGPAQTMMYLQFQHSDEPAVGISGTDGRNPFRDMRVRQAVSKAIDREAIVDKIMRNQGIVATNAMGKDYLGFNPDLKPEKFDPDGARKLLAEAGYPDGFSIVMGGTNDRYSNDAKISQAIAQMLGRIGIKVELEVSPYVVFIKKWQASEYPLFFGGLAVASVDMAQTLRALIGTPKYAPSFGVVNYGKYSNPELDEIMRKAVGEMDEAKRDELLQEANKIAVETYAILPLFHPNNVWAHSSSIDLQARNDNVTLAISARPVAQ